MKFFEPLLFSIIKKYKTEGLCRDEAKGLFEDLYEIEEEQLESVLTEIYGEN